MLASAGNLRAIQPLSLPSTERAVVKGKRPDLRWVKPTDLLVDETYQRDLTRQSISLIGDIVKNFAWNRMKPPIVTPVGKGLHVIDGQHTAIAAASLGLEALPVFVVDAVDLIDRAGAFVTHNRARVNISKLQIHRALLAAGEETAVEMQSVCDKVGVRLRVLSRSSAINVGDTASVSTVRAIVETHGPMRARQTLEACVKGKRAPIGEAELLAALSIVREAQQNVPSDALAAAIRIEGDEAILRAKAQAQMTRSPAWKCLADIYRKRMTGKTK